MSETARTTEQIEADLRAASERLAGHVQEFLLQVHPRAVVSSVASDARALVAGQVRNLKAELLDEQGRPRSDRLALIGGAILGAVTFVVIMKSIFRKN